MNKDHSTITEQYTISELNRHGRVFHGTKIPVGRDPETGKVRQFSYVKHTKDEVSDAILSDTRSPLQGAVQEKLCTDITIGELADRFWQSKQAFMSSSYKYSMNYWLDSIKRYLNDLPAADLSATRAELFQTELMLEENGPSNCSINSIMSVLGSVMEFAKGEQIPVFNPIKYISRLPKTNKKCRLPDISQLNAFLELMKDLGDYYILTILLISLGIRFGECIAITEDDILYDRHLIHIHKHIIWQREVTPHRTQLRKNRKMNDTYYVTYPENSLPYIRDAISLQEERRHRYGAEYHNHAHFILTDENGDMIQHSRYYSRFKHRARKCGMPDLAIHDMRRIVAMNLYRKTGDVRAVQSALGHIQPYSSTIYLMKLSQSDSPITFTADEAYRHLAEERI